MIFWKKLTLEERTNKVQDALNENVNFFVDASLGYPASKLDSNVFNDNFSLIKDAPTLQTFIANPNHIGCHTYGDSESAFKGTQEIEREVLNVLAVDIFKSEPKKFDGYISPGGTEANIQAIWMYRNHFMNDFDAKLDEIVIISSEDTHYSIAKGSNLLMIDWIKVPVGFDTREIEISKLDELVSNAKNKGKKYFIAVANMGTTMFGSVDNPNVYVSAFQKNEVVFKLHIDGAYGGFVYPFSNEKSDITFKNPHISSFTIDAHKMLQAPYGTGIFICRKGLIEHVMTKEAEYVEGMDLTLCGSRSGANAIAVWMILFTFGPYGWFEKISILQMRTRYLCQELENIGIEYFREPFMNIVTVKSDRIPEHIAKKFDLVPQQHHGDNKWYKIVIMSHVGVEHLAAFIEELKAEIEALA